jgi:hypothetical protein
LWVLLMQIGHQTLKTITVYVYLLAGGAISWCSKKQHTATLSSTKPEYESISQASREAIWVRRLITDFSLNGAVALPTKILGDNQGALALVKKYSSSLKE